jgi:hypothetical protein
MHGWTEQDVAGDPDAQAATDWLRRHYLATFVERYGAWLDAQSSWPLAWQDVAGSSDFALRLSPSRLAAFQAEVETLFHRFRADSPATGHAAGSPDAEAPDADAEIVQIYLYAFPLEPSPR